MVSFIHMHVSFKFVCKVENGPSSPPNFSVLKEMSLFSLERGSTETKAKVGQKFQLLDKIKM